MYLMPSYRMFIDDTGNVHSRTNNHPQNRFAGIVGVIFELDYLRTTFEPSFNRLKARHFGLRQNGETYGLHLRRMKKAETPFDCLANDCCRERWEADCFSMYSRASYSVITVCVDKVAFYAAHPNWNRGIYELLVGNAIERYFYFLRNKGSQGDVLTEACNPELDKQIDELYTKFYNNGTEHINRILLQNRLSSNKIKIKPKAANVAGLQLADLLAATCFSHCKRIYINGGDFDPFAMKVADLIESEKFYRDSSGNPHRYGRVWRP